MNKRWIGTTWRYFAYVTLLHVTIGGLAYLLLKEQLAFFLAVELVLFVSLYVAYQFYRTFMAPVRLVEQGEGAMKDGDFTVKFIPVGSSEIDRLVHLYNSMIDNLRAERTGTQEQHFFLEKLIATAELGVIVMNHDGQIAKLNEWATRKLNRRVGEPAPAELSEIDHPLARAMTNLPLNQPAIVQLSGNQRFRVERGDFIDRGFPRSFILIQDITRDLLAAEKDAYGKIIRMMAHEVNNSTGATNSLLNSLVDTADLGDEELRSLMNEYLPVVIERGAAMNEFMRKFAGVIRLPAPKLAAIDLREVINRCCILFQANCQEVDIQLMAHHPDLPVLVRADAGQLEQVIINAIKNARESIGAGGNIRLSTQTSPAGFTIADNGPGIEPQYAELIFTPFFSTKPTGQGVGLTLMRDILEQHHATYQLTTESDGWTRLVVVF